MSEKRNGNANTYSYDGLGQLTRANLSGQASWAYEYDRGGNLVSKKKYAYTTGTLGAVQQTIAYEYGNAKWKDQLTKYNGKAIVYDAIGNPTSYDGWTYEWQAGRQLKKMVKSGTTAEYTYDHNGLRVKKAVNGVTTDYVLHGKLITWVKSGNDTLKITYDANGRPAMVQYNGVWYGYVKNLQGDIVGIIDSNGTEVVKYSYDAWGKVMSTSGSKAGTLGKVNPFRYRGYVYDEESGLYYLRSRYYNPGWGRFINADSGMSDIGEAIFGYNLFVYCFSNPTNMNDTEGEWPQWLTGTLNVVGGAFQMVAGAALGATTSWTGVGAVAAAFLIGNGAATVTQGMGQIVNDISKSKIMREDNIIQTGVQTVGQVIGGDTGEKIAEITYNAAVTASGLYAGRVNLQNAGLAPIKVNMSQLLNNPSDEFVTIGPKPGAIGNYCRSIPAEGYGKIYVTQLPNGFYRIANGHHRVAALRQLGVESVKVYLTK